MRLRVAELFASIQGEGRFTGVPSAFVRLSGCNLRCSWCDTPYASWNPEGDHFSIEDIIQEVLQLNTPHVVLTGGEPMLFEGIQPLTEAFRQAHKTITIETAGTVYREIPCDLMSISPKLSNSTPDPSSGWSERHETTRLNREPLKALVEAYDHQLKFVVNPEDNLDSQLQEISELLEPFKNLKPENIMLMPEGRDTNTLTRRAKLLVQTCMERQWRLCGRYHVDLFGDTRGT